MTITKIGNDPRTWQTGYTVAASDPRVARLNSAISTGIRDLIPRQGSRVKDVIEPVIAHIDSFTHEVDLLQIDFPPFFPPGSPQRIFMIDLVNKTLDNIEATLKPSGGQNPKELELPRLSAEASNDEITSMAVKLLEVKEDLRNEFSGAGSLQSACATPDPGEGQGSHMSVEV